ncbi:MAG: MATE family efflux transporter, partial [Paracoccaceae bacterium]
VATGARIFDAARLRRMASVNGHIMLRSILLQGCFTAFLFLSSGRGDLVIASNQILLQFLELMAYLLDGFAFAAETLVGQAVGARAVAGVRQATRLAMFWGFAGAALLAAAFALAGGPIIELMTTSPEVRAEARIFLPWLVAAPLLGTAAWTWDGVFIGATLTRAMRQVMVLCVGIYVVALAVLVPTLGNHGLWAALMVLNLVRSVLMTRRYPEAEAKARALAAAV